MNIHQMNDTIRDLRTASEALARVADTMRVETIKRAQGHAPRTSSHSITREQQKLMFGMWGEVCAALCKTNTDLRRHEFTLNVLGHDVPCASWAALSEAQADAVIGALSNVLCFAKAVQG